jgi:hypothetical protein
MIVSEKRLAANRANSFFRQFGGRAPDHMRCETIRKRTGERCKHWRCRDSRYCRFHGGRRSRGKGRNNYNPTPIYNGRISILQGRKMPPIYRKYLRKTLSHAVNELCNMPPDEQLQVFEELALMREAAGQAIALYGAARSVVERLPPETPDENKHQAIGNMMEAASIMREALMQVVKIVETARKLEDRGKDKIGLHMLQHFVDQIVVFVYQTFGDDPRVEQFCIAVRDGVKIPDSRANGTMSLPSDDAAAAGASVPRTSAARPS